MKKTIVFLLLVAIIASCDNQKNQTTNDSELQSKVDSLQRVISQKEDEMNDMLGTFNEIQNGLRQVSEAENKVTLMKDGESVNKSAQIRETILFISERMKHNRELITKLRQQLRQSSLEGNKFKETIEDLVQQLDAKDRELQTLRAELNAKDIHIAELDQAVTSLNENVSALRNEGEQKSQTISAQDKQLNTAWYVFGTKKELKDQHIVEGSKVLQSNFNKGYFTKIDIRIDKEIRLYSKSAKIVTNHPAGSYTLQPDANKQYVLRITNPEQFWSTSRYLVVVVK